MDIYLFVIIALLLLAISNIWVGVANDATNFLGPAVGSKAAPFKTVLIVAAIGIIVGVTFSSGMMEVARKGIVHPEMFHFQEIIIIFLAYAIGDLILLDLFNTFGLPTSTTLSLIFGLVGGGTVVSLLKISEMGGNVADLDQYINTAKVLTFATAIVLSIVLSFLFGAIIQYLSRLLFTFDYAARFKRWGGIWCSLAITLILYFILMKGVNGASFISAEWANIIKNYTSEIMLASFVFWSVVLHLVINFTKINVLKGIVLMGTFSLAMSFAANDLVNFLGAPLAAISAYATAGASATPFEITMAPLNDPYKANTLVLLAAGFLMVVILYLSKKSRTVTKTSVGLGSQEEEVERFQSFAISRGLVRSVITFFDGVQKITPEPVKRFVSSRFDKSKMPSWDNDKVPPPAFDLIRASINLVVAAALISFGTSLKLPLSTTYVTFIVAMATAFSDRAWGRDTAVYRVSGVLTVIGGWFVTAFMASLIVGTIAFIIWHFSFAGMAAMIALAMFLVFRSTLTHRKREREFEEKEKLTLKHHVSKDELFDNIVEGVSKHIHAISNLISNCSDGIIRGDLKFLRTTKQESKLLPKNSDTIISYVAKSIKKFNELEISRAHSFTDLIGYLNVLSSLGRRLSIQTFDYFDNNHMLLTSEQLDEIGEVSSMACSNLSSLANCVMDREYFNEFIDARFEAMKDVMDKYKTNQARRMIAQKSSSWQNLLYLSFMDYCERLVLNSMKCGQAMKKFFAK